ncbi:hypothetical protein PR001_g28420 [Phytophthora rubi]|uniref:Uncharacterized protein n=1 Tax=Phytophthora rubi TaxID=129364 RepID=A0A6A3HA64_9STRA|nr:hypothetical protein PR001_g28420 [Phytophthora rubi]
MPKATKKSGKTSGKNANVQPQATSKSTPSQGSSEDTQQSKRKRDQDEDEVDGESAKNKTARVTRNATAEAAEAVEGETIRQTSDDQELSLADLAEAVPALKKMHARMKGGKRQASKRRSSDKFKLSPSMLEVFADRYLAARNAHKGVDYPRLSTTKNFKDFKGHAEELRAKEPELKVLLMKALAEQREIDAGKPMKNIEALEEEIVMLGVQHKEDVAKCKQLEVDIEQQEEQHSLMISKLKESYEVEIGKLQNELNEVKAKYDALNELAIDTANGDRDVAIKNADYLLYELDQEIKRANVLKMKLDSYAACCDTEHCIETFLGERIHDYLKMSRLEQCRVVVEKMKKVNPKDAASLEEDLAEFFQTRNFLCHEPGAVDKTDHLSFHQRCVSIQRCMEYLEKQSD